MVITLTRILVIAVLVSAFGCTRPSRSAKTQMANKPQVLQQAASSVAPKVFMLPAGTRFSVRLAEGITTEKAPAGSKVEGELAAPISAFAETIAPRGARVVAEVADKNRDGIILRATKIQLKSGKSYDIASDEPVLHAERIPAESLVGFRLRNPVQVTVE